MLGIMILVYTLNGLIFICSIYFCLQWFRTKSKYGDIIYPLEIKKAKNNKLHRRYNTTSNDFMYKVGIGFYFITALVSAFILVKPLVTGNYDVGTLEILLSWLPIYNALMATNVFEIRKNGLLNDGYFYKWDKVNYYKMEPITITSKYYGLVEPGVDYVELKLSVQRKIMPNKMSFIVEEKYQAHIEECFAKNLVKENEL